MIVTTVIKTRCRPTLEAAIKSALREEFAVIAVSDGFPFPSAVTELQDCARLVRLGRHYGHYGAMAFNTGVMLAETEFVAMLDDDDEWIEGAGDLIRAKLEKTPETDIWIPGLEFNDGKRLCCDPVWKHNNLACPILRTTVLTKAPLLHLDKGQSGTMDQEHLKRCHDLGFAVDWIGQPCILVRPHLQGDRGMGEE